MANLTGLPSIRGVVARFSRLAADGTTPAGATNGYIKKFVNLVITPEYREGDTLEVRLADGSRCVDAEEPAVPRRVGVELQVCEPDAEFHELIAGYTLAVTGADTIGASFPAVGVNPVPNGVALEVWSRRSNSDLTVPTAGGGHYRWLLPRLYFRGNPKEISNGPMTHAFAGFGVENANIGNGPANDVPAGVSAARAFSWWADTTAPPAAATGYVATIAQV